MKTKLLALITGGLLLMIASPVSAQTSTTGAVKGIITDETNGQPIAGATVVVTSPALQGTQAEITDASGAYFISNLPPGTYRMTVYYADAEFSRGNVLVQLGKVAQVNLDVNTQASKGEVIEIEGRAPIIDQGSTKTGRSITEDFTNNIPTGRTFGAVLGAAAGSQGDLYGTSFSGSTSAENVYIIEGLNTTDPAYGLQTTNLPNEFIQETELITGGYNAEFGRSTGGLVNVLTKSGSNEFHGSVFAYLTPGALVAAEELTPNQGSSIELNEELSFETDFGAELGGPIIKDKLWFHVGFNPRFRQLNTHRIIQSQVDADNDGTPDVDPDTGFSVLEEVGRNTYSNGSQTMFFTAKLTGAVSPEHQGSVSFFGNPRSLEGYVSVTGVETANRQRTEDGAWDVSAKWTSKLNDNKTQVDVVAGWHRNLDRDFPALDGGSGIGLVFGPTRSLEDYDMYETMDGNSVPAGCLDAIAGGDSRGDKYPNIRNCPVRSYRVGGLGFREVETNDRLSARLDVSQRFKVAGQHIVKAGIDGELQSYDKLSTYTDGQRFVLSTTGRSWRLDRYYGFEPGGDEMCNLGNGTVVPCTWKRNGITADTGTRNLSAYVQDSWQILPNLTVNAGVRWESQSLLAAEEVAGRVSPITGETFPEVAFDINDMVAPRLGVIYDPTQEGRAKILGHWGRFYESIPMDINARGFGGEVLGRYTLAIDPMNETLCPVNLSPNNPEQLTACSQKTPAATQFLGGGDEQVDPDIGGQYLDEIILGGEYELFNDLKLGASYIRRSLGRVIEDVSTDGGTNYIIANPGEGIASEFDDPTRTYNALQLTAERRFTRDMMVIASYTLSRTAGNFPGLFSPETGQLDPNLTSMYDLPELMANRDGPLAADRTHLLKVDGYYRLNLEQIGYFIFGSSIRAASGIPHNYLGAHIGYGAEETFILPRASADRSPWATQFDVRVQYGRQLNKTMRLEAFMDVVNLLNLQPEVNADDEYTPDIVNPIVGGDESDLVHLKPMNPVDGSEENRAVELNPNFNNVTVRQDPLSMRFGLRLTF